MRYLLIAAILVSCSRATVDEPGQAPPSKAPVAAPAASRPRPAPAPPATVEGVWRWRTKKDDPEFMNTPDLRVREDETYRFVTDTPHGAATAFVWRIDANSKTVWARELESQFVDAAAMAYADGRVFVAHHSHIASGCGLYALDADTGEVVWHSQLRGLGPVSHSKYRNRVQIRIDGDRIAVYGWESSGRYVEIVDAATGKTLSNSQPAEALAAIEWQWDSPERRSFRAGPDTVSAAGGGSITYQPRDRPEPAELIKRDAGGGELWKTSFDSQGQCGTAAMLENGDDLYVVHYCSIASGARLYVFDTATGKLLRDDPLDGLGPIGHSEYFNDVEIRFLNAHIVVFGKEAAGRYIEARRASTSALVSSQVFSDW
jgi:outer membrane protein assembly factor BamB